MLTYLWLATYWRLFREYHDTSYSLLVRQVTHSLTYPLTYLLIHSLMFIVSCEFSPIDYLKHLPGDSQDKESSESECLEVFSTTQICFSLTHSSTHSLNHPTNPPLTHSSAHSLVHSPTHSLIHSLTRPPTRSLTHSLTRPLTHSSTRPPTHSLTLTPSFLYSEALEIISSVATHVNETMRQMENFKKVVEVSKKLIGDVGDSLVTPHRVSLMCDSVTCVMMGVAFYSGY